MSRRIVASVAAAIGSVLLATSATAAVPGLPQPTKVNFQLAPTRTMQALTYETITFQSSLVGLPGWTAQNGRFTMEIGRVGFNRFMKARAVSITAEDDWESPSLAFRSAPFTRAQFVLGAGTDGAMPASTYVSVVAFAAGKRMNQPVVLPVDWTGSTVITVDVSTGNFTEVSGLDVETESRTTRRGTGTASFHQVMDRLVVYPSDLAGNAVNVDITADDVVVAQRCTLVGTESGETLVGTANDDVICALGGDDVVRGLGGDDILLGSDGADRLVGGTNNDLLKGGRGNDTLRGNDGTDECNGESDTDNADSSCETTRFVP